MFLGLFHFKQIWRTTHNLSQSLLIKLMNSYLFTVGFFGAVPGFCHNFLGFAQISFVIQIGRCLVREGPFWVLVGAQMPSVLVEIGFISHPTESRRLVTSKYQKKLAYGLADGIERYFVNSN